MERVAHLTPDHLHLTAMDTLLNMYKNQQSSKQLELVKESIKAQHQNQRGDGGEWRDSYRARY